MSPPSEILTPPLVLNDFFTNFIPRVQQKASNYLNAFESGEVKPTKVMGSCL